MNRNDLLALWKAEEQAAYIHGWDFSHIQGRYTEETDLPWDYREVIKRHLKPEMCLLDVDTGGGEFLLSLHHPYSLTSATEGYLPNVDLCQKMLLPLGIDFRQADGKNPLPFENNSFDMIINRHGDWNAGDIYRLLKPGGLLITEQVGAKNDRELVRLLLPQETALPFPEQFLSCAAEKLRGNGFVLLEQQECFRPIRFFDVGALVWFARIIEWEFPGFSVETCSEQLFAAQALLEKTGQIEGSIHRFLIVAQKPEHK